MPLSKIASDSVIAEAKRDSLIAQELINLIDDAEIRKELLSLIGIPTDKLVEFVIAYALGSKAIDGNGMDFSCGGEAKFSTVNLNPSKGRLYKEGNISGLSAKTGTLHIIVCDQYSDVRSEGFFRFWSIPYKEWSHYTNGGSKKLRISLGDVKQKWYSKFEYSREEFMAGVKRLPSKPMGLELF